ncbi:MAG: flavin reductase family protein [Anaerovoracaceae bacterium]|jgi:flavin reductase (DIM6/NTAB) family NADH-FMN oxidoreductase RutF
MKKDIGAQRAVFPMPVLMVATYDEEGKVDVMNAAWGMISGADKIALFISEGHKTTQNIRKQKAFTVSLADSAHEVEADYFGVVSANNVADKFEKSGMHATGSDKVNAPVIDEFPLAMECELAEITETDNLHAVVGTIVNVKADESVLDAEGKIAAEKLNAIMFDGFGRNYFTVGEKAGTAYSDGKKLLK